jgi:hypothetical protein
MNIDSISLLGNYAEIYERNLGTLIPDHGLNRVWTEGGILISPPFLEQPQPTPDPNQ